MLLILGVPLDERLSVAEPLALAQPAVERLQALRGVPHEQHKRDLSEIGNDVSANLRLVVHSRRRVQLVLRNPALEQSADRGLRPRNLEGVRVRQKLCAELLGL